MASNRGPKPDRALDAELVAVGEQLENLGYSPTPARVALVVSVRRGERITREAVRARMRRIRERGGPSQ